VQNREDMFVMLIFINAVFLEYLVTNLSSFLINSDVLYPKDTSSPHSGVPAEVLCRGRDFVVSIKVFIVFKAKWRCSLPERPQRYKTLLLYCNKVFLPKRLFVL